MRLRSLMMAGLLVSACASSTRSDTSDAPAVTAETVQPQWMAWEADTFAKAEADDRIILINVVATWCHWCHVMEETTYADPEVAKLLREHFVTIRVDSDARPDIAERYREWGWPATAVLTPQANPVTELRGYRKPETFLKLLRGLIADREAGKLGRRGQPQSKPSATQLASAKLREAVAAQLDGYFEPEQGGWGKMQKYPFPQPVEHALVRGRLHGEGPWLSRALQTLEGSAKLVDPVWGGMYQYSLKGDWEHPHYEKITAIQGGALTTFGIATRVTGDERWLEPAMKVRAYMNDFMRDPQGGYFTSQDADLRKGHGQAIVGLEFYAMNDTQRRAQGFPRIDDNVYADLNGFMIRGLVELYLASGDPQVLDDAIRAAQRVLETHRDDSGALKHGAQDADEGLRYLRDQATMAWGMLALYHATADTRWRDEAKALGDVIVTRLQDAERGGFYAHTPDPAAAGVFAERRKPLEENGLAARVLLRLHRVLDGDGTESTPYRKAAQRALRAVGDLEGVRAEGRIVGTYLLALEELDMPTVDITVVGDDDDPQTAALFQAAIRYPEPRGVVERSAPGERYPNLGKAAVYLCTANSCSAPIKDAALFVEKADAVLAVALPPVP